MKDARCPGHIPLVQGISTIGQYSTGTSLCIHKWGIHNPNTPPLSARSSDAADNTAHAESEAQKGYEYSTSSATYAVKPGGI